MIEVINKYETIMVINPTLEEETEILKKHHAGFDASHVETGNVEVVCSKQQIIELRKHAEGMECL